MASYKKYLVDEICVAVVYEEGRHSRRFPQEEELSEVIGDAIDKYLERFGIELQPAIEIKERGAEEAATNKRKRKNKP